MDEERKYVIVKWTDDRYQIRCDSRHVLRWLAAEMQCTICVDELTEEEAHAIFKLYPKDKQMTY